ncbi:cysteine-rich secretory protein 3 [Tupaia chinensis]|uniref:cysteine-rich secretory protein 3 n=1 Tax=Tupaia chinensis TaxID=246437 RepID=UPI0003C921BE|nr:cysteine-rich secretory protein 3 [Tupaia chinensis]XP_027627910.1 cysteine-rich secretory protein 3 [Tupaia chinensis]XP_027627911.1 cysteine-rich secretory protein 3 [Tupaia chinensis]
MASFVMLAFLAAVLLPFPANGHEDAALSTELPEVQEEIINKHNELRKAVSPSASNMLKMQWDSFAAANAQKWADQCILKHSKPEQRKTDVKCGENLFLSSHPVSWSHAIDSWYKESQNFEYNSGPKTPKAVVGHYTQVVWSTSFKVGCACAYCPNEKLRFFYVCQYCPAGNLVTKMKTPYKQGEPCDSCPDHCDDGLCTNACEYEDNLSNCEQLKNMVGCSHSLTKTKCKASCNCINKIY